MAAAGVLELTDQNFEETIKASDKPVLVDFWAAWCGPCKRIAPIIDEIATEYAGKVAVGKVDVDSNQEVAGRHGISSIPTLMIFKGGALVDRIVGAQPKDIILSHLRPHM